MSYVLDYYRQSELFRMGFDQPPPPDEEKMKAIDRDTESRRQASARWRAKKKQKPISKVLCPKCFQHIEIVRNYHRTNMLYNCNHCGAVLTKWEIFGTMAKDA